MEIFRDFSSPGNADSKTLKKRDSMTDFGPSKQGSVTQNAASDPAGDLAGIDAEDLAGWTDVGKRGGVGAGYPDLRAEF